MALDGMFIYALLKELQSLIGGRISKIYQPFERDLIFHIRAQGQVYRLLLSADPTYPRVYISTEQLPNPEQAPLFCMVLRKHLEGGIIEQISQEAPGERMIRIDIRSRDELGRTVSKRLMVEIMGRHSNIILLDVQSGKIIDSIRHVSSAISQYRIVLPGQVYTPPPDQGKLNPFSVEQETFLKKINFNQGKLDQQIVQHFQGISPLLAKEILYQAGLPERENVWQSFKRMILRIKNGPYDPVVMEEKERVHFYLFPLEHVQGGVVRYSSLSAMLDDYFQTRTRQSRLKQTSSDLTRQLTRILEKNKKKLEVLRQTIAESENADQYRMYGELLLANMHLVKRGDKQIEVTNYYDEQQGQIIIPLEPDLSPSENAQRFFKTYNKLKVAQEKAKEQLEHTEQEIMYLETLLHQLELADWSDLEEIRQEIIEQGYLRPHAKSKKKKPEPPQPKQFYSSEGVLILVGGNNKQNDYLTTQLASAQDTWLHTKEIPGSHVVIKSRNITETTLREAAILAAYFSKARHSSQVPVDYTLIKHVRKPKGAKPGFVIYDHHKTIYVTPDQDVLEKLTEKN
jgi:predicted ribosome quality control (RQC) complex YloA/Tae2 family protein